MTAKKFNIACFRAKTFYAPRVSLIPSTISLPYFLSSHCNPTGIPMGLFRDLNQAAIEANVGKNGYKVFLALLEQTLGYGKSTDRLTDNRLAYLSKVRIDRFRPAVQAVLACGVFEQTPAKKFQFRYTIGQSFLEKYPDKEFYTPALPKKRADFRKTEEISEKERHTALDLNSSLSSILQPLQTLIQSSTDMMQQQIQQQNEWISTLLQAQTNQNHTDQTLHQPQNSARPTAAPADMTPA